MTQNVVNNVTLTPKQRRALDSLAGGASWADAATAAGVSVRTLQRWRNEPGFASAVRLMTRGALQDAARRLMGNADTAVSALIELAAGGDADDDDGTAVPESVRLRAADLLLQHAARLQELADIGERLDALEELMRNVR